MKRFVAIAAIVGTFAALAVVHATTTWTNPVPGFPVYHTVKATGTTITEAAPTLVTHGIDLSNLKSYDVTISTNLVINDSADAAIYGCGETEVGDGGECVLNTIFNTCMLEAYIYAPTARAWTRAPDLDICAQGGVDKTSWTKTGIAVPSVTGRLAYVPVGCGTPLYVYITSHI